MIRSCCLGKDTKIGTYKELYSSINISVNSKINWSHRNKIELNDNCTLTKKVKQPIIN